MDFKLSIITIILVLAFYLPGYFFRKFYFGGFSTKQFGHGEWYDRLFLSIFFGLVIQYISIKILRDAIHFKFEANVSVALNEIIAKVSKNELPLINLSNFKTCIYYLLFTFFIAIILGLFARSLIRITTLDLRIMPLRYSNIWHYYFRGDILKTADFDEINSEGDWVATRIDVLMDIDKDGQKMLYNGKVVQYDLSIKGDRLERLYITEAKRYSKAKADFIDVPGEILMLKGEKILNINYSYDRIKNVMGRKKKIFYITLLVILLVFLFSPVLLIPYYYFKRISLFRIILSVFESGGILILFYALLAVLFTKRKNFHERYKNQSKTKVIWATLLAVVISGVVLLLTIGELSGFFQSILLWFKRIFN